MRGGMTLATLIVFTFMIALLIDFYWAGAFFIIAPLIIYNLWDEFFDTLEDE